MKRKEKPRGGIRLDQEGERGAGSARLGGITDKLAAPAHRGPQVLGQVLERGQRRDQGGHLLGRQASEGFGNDGTSLLGDPFVNAPAFRRYLDPGRAEIIGATKPLYQPKGIKLADTAA